MDLQNPSGCLIHNGKTLTTDDVKAIADSIAVMYQGCLVQYGPKIQVLAPPFDDHTALLLSPVAKMKIGWLEKVLGTRKIESAGN